MAYGVNISESNAFKLENRDTFLGQVDYASMTVSLKTVGSIACGEFAWGDRDEKILLLLHNTNSSSASSVTVKAGNGIQGVNDLKVTLEAGKFTVVALDSGRFKNVSGEHKGKCLIEAASNAVRAAVFILP